MFLLTDQFLADSARAVPSFKLEDLPYIQPPAVKLPSAAPYQRFALTQDGLSPRLIPGLTEHRVVAGSDEHGEDGHLTEDLGVRKMMAEKRLKKTSGILQEVICPGYSGDKNPDLLLLSWGSTRGAVLEAAEELRARIDPSAFFISPRCCLMVPNQFIGFLQAAKQVVAIEGNATGQLAGLIRPESGFEIQKRNRPLRRLAGSRRSLFSVK